MEMKIERDISGNYMVLDCDATDYKIRMLESNRIPGLLPLTVREENGNKRLYYNISSKISFADAIAARSLGEKEIRNMVYSISRILTNVQEHLLSASDIVLDQKLVYVKTPEMEPSVCCIPGYCGDFASQFSSLLRELLGAVDQRDKNAVVLTYSLYQESTKPNYVMEDILRILRYDSISEIEQNAVRAVEDEIAASQLKKEEVDTMYEFLSDEALYDSDKSSRNKESAKPEKRKRRFFIF